ncbi:MAG TPA: DUF1571 domain-containing protein [Pirellulales bacterium]|nr:DUF1571 domain-containing protein [Pirellulales bacterium]
MKLLYSILTGSVAGCLLAVVGCGAPAAQGTAPPASTADADGAPVQAENAQPADGHKETPSSDAASDLDRALALARQSLANLETIKDYTCVFSKRERVGDVLLPEERSEMKIRHQPFSVYLRAIEPTSSAGQEVIYVEGRNDGNLIAHTTGFGSSVIGRLSLDPHGYLATRGNRYTIKDVGLANLVQKLIDLGSKKELFRDSTTTIEKTEFAERPCTQVEISSPRPVGDFRLAIARIVLDDEWDVPVHFESHEWPAGDAAEPVLSETYSYYDLKLNVGLTDRDFDPDNPEYSFP